MLHTSTHPSRAIIKEVKQYIDNEPDLSNVNITDPSNDDYIEC